MDEWRNICHNTVDDNFTGLIKYVIIDKIIILLLVILLEFIKLFISYLTLLNHGWKQL